MKKTLLLFILILLNFELIGNSYKIRYLTAEEGLSRNFVNHISKDSKGFIWISTVKGLDRFDGYNFVRFTSPNRPNSIPSDVINFAQEGKHGNMWIGTENGLFVLEYQSGKIISAEKHLGISRSYFKGSFNFVRRDDSGNLWIGHAGGIILLRDTGDKYVCDEIFSGEDIVDVCLFSGNIYIGQGSQVFRIIKDKNQKYKRLAADEKISRLDGVVTKLFYDNGTIWIGTGSGLYRYDPATENLLNYNANPLNQASLTSNSITEICKNKDGKLLVGTLIGLNIYDYQSNTFSRITSEKNRINARLNNNFISCIFPDNELIWIGTEKGGVNLIFPDQQFFTNVSNLPEDPGSLSENPVNAIYEDDEGDFWIGTVEGGLNFRKKGTDYFRHFTHMNENNHSISHNSVSAICQDIDRNYWVGTWGNGLNFFSKKDKSNPSFQSYYSDENSNNAVKSNFIAAVIPDKKTRGIWIGSNIGVDYYSLKEKRFYNLLPGLANANSIRLVTGLLIDRKQQLWIATGNGLFCINLAKSDIIRNQITYKHFHYLLSEPNSGIVEKINCILETSDHQMWFGSNGNGLYQLTGSVDKPEFKHVDVTDGLIDNVIYGLLEDASGTIWMSTDKGICAYNPAKKSFRNFTVTDGLTSNQFYWDAFCKGKDGKLYFGHLLGYTSFDPLKYLIPYETKQVAISGISVLNENVFPANEKNADQYLDFEHSVLKRLTLKESDKAFSVEFSALSYFLPDKIRYAYRLKGFDNDWKEIGADRRFANFTNIKHGTYQFEVKCSNPDGNWSEQVSVLEIHVIPPFYKTWWFILILIFLLIYSIYSFTNYRINSLKKQEIHLKELVAERTREIEAQKEKVQEATLDKIAFFTNITHEFRTPVTLILGPVERALKLSTNPKVIEQLDIVKRNSRLLLSLINQLMDFRKVDSGKMELSKTNQDFIRFLGDIVIPFEDLGKDRGVHFETILRLQAPEFLFDRDSMHKLMGNLLSNALKFTPDNGNITINAATFTDKTDMKEKLYVSVRDSGPGIPEDDLEKIFERFYQSKNQQVYTGSGQSGTGIGLYLCSKIVELYNGSIEAVNHQSGGAVIRFIIPVERNPGNDIKLPETNIQELLVSEMHEDNEEIHESNKKPVLLIVEDNRDMRQYIRSILNDDYHILEAADGSTGLKQTRQAHPDLIISDIMMPGMDGIEFLKEIRMNFNTSHIPVILLTAKSSVETQIEGFQTGADAFLVKPFNEELLKAVLTNLAEKNRKMQQHFNQNMDASVLNIREESQDKKFVEKALKVINAHYTNPEFDVAEFIDEMGISRSLLHKKLSTLTGQSASRFIRTYRLNTARELIIRNRESHAMNISEIAYQVGFNDPKYFTRCFTKQFGIQPSTLMEEKN